MIERAGRNGGVCYLLRNNISVRIKSEGEIFETRKTLRVSSVNDHHSRQGSTADLQHGQSRKPLGSHFVSDQFSNFFNAYAKTINKAYGRTGSLFQHPFGRVPITTDRQFWNVIAYIHQNPQKHGFVKDFRQWKYSSYGVILSDKATVVKRNEVMKWFGTGDDPKGIAPQPMGNGRPGKMPQAPAKILIEIRIKTLTPIRGQVVSSVNDYNGGQGKLAYHQHGRPRKPLGSPSFIGRKWVVMDQQTQELYQFAETVLIRSRSVEMISAFLSGVEDPPRAE